MFWWILAGWAVIGLVSAFIIWRYGGAWPELAVRDIFFFVFSLLLGPILTLVGLHFWVMELDGKVLWTSKKGRS